jgi:hypothetical protein
MKRSLHESPLTTDQISSIRIDRSIDDYTWRLIKNAVMLGLLFPNTNANNPDEMPEREGTFHFAYILAPVFRLLPRRGKARSLRTVIRNPVQHDQSAEIPDPRQNRLPFDREIQ